MRMLLLFVILYVPSLVRIPGRELSGLGLAVLGIRPRIEMLTSGTSDCNITIGTWASATLGISMFGWPSAQCEHGQFLELF